MENAFSDSQNCSQLQAVQQAERIDPQFQQRHLFRQQKLKNIKHRLSQNTNDRIRHKQNIFLYFINLALPITLSYINAWVLLEFGINSELKGKIIPILVGFGFCVSVYSCLKIAPWRQVLRLFFHFDSIIPFIISTIIAFFSILNFSSAGQWYMRSYAISFPVWIIYYAGSLRVMIAYLNWSRWEVLLYKTVVISCAMISFYVGYQYMNGAYKVTYGYLKSVEDKLKNLVYLYVFGAVELFFRYYRMLSQFDQTKNLKFQYQFKDESVQLSKVIENFQLYELQREVIQQDIQDAISVRQINSKRFITKKFNDPLREMYL